jgi:3-methylfumaryl-CoA hydratase
VTVQHELSGASGLAIIEEQDLVFREPAAGTIPGPVDNGEQPGTTWHETVDPDTVLLFRYSALTMNGHRIHYDLPYARDEEAYPALVVHGPLQATILADLAVRNLAGPVTGFDFRGQAPAFAGTTLHVCGEPGPESEGSGTASVWTQQGGAKNMVATVTSG